MKNYVKPMVLANEELAEGVYADSGNCYNTWAKIEQKPTTGFDYYVVKVHADHNASHHSTAQQLIITFNQAVTYGYCNSGCASLASGNGTKTLTIDFAYHNNLTETIELSDLYVTSNSGLEVVSATMTCNKTCAQHDGLGNY